MKTKILDIIKNNKKRFSQIIKRDEQLNLWVTSNSKIQSNNYAEHIYSALNGTTGICCNNNKLGFISVNKGYSFCGHASICKCNRENSIVKVSETKKQYSDLQKHQIEHKRTTTMYEKFGVQYNSQRPEIKLKLQKPKIDPCVQAKLLDKEWMNLEYNAKQRSLVDIGQELGVYYGTVGMYCKKHDFAIRQRSSYSLIELDILNYIKSLSLEVEHSNWDVLTNREIDILIPSINLGIEINGLYWHSFNPNQHCKEEDKHRHLNKTLDAKDKGIELIHITDYEWGTKQPIIKSLISNRAGLSTRIYARKCEVKTVDKQTEKLFLDNNHLQGYVPSDTAIGLFFNRELVSIMSLGKSRFNKKYSIELLRYCSKLNTTVVGGGKKLLTAIKKRYENLKMISYCDVSKFSGNVYIELGFTKIKDSFPGYFWTDGDSVISRFKSQKKQLAKWLVGFDPNLTEVENMFNAGYRRYWDCGNAAYVLT